MHTALGEDNRLVGVTIDSPDSSVGYHAQRVPQTPRKLKIMERVITDKVEADKEERKFNHSVMWRSCCLEVDRRAVSFFSQLAFSVVIVAFCVVMLGMFQDCATFSRYSPLVTLVIGIWLPQPQLRGLQEQ